MPTVPRISQNQVSLRGIPTVRFTQSAPIQAFGGGPEAQAQTRATNNLIANFAEKAQEEIDNADKVAITERDRFSTEEQLRLEQKYLGLRGKNAIGATQQALQEWEDFVAKTKENIPNERQEIAFDTDSFRRKIQLNRKIESHSSREFEVYDAENSEAYRANLTVSAATNYKDPERFSAETSALKQSIVDQAGRNGIGEDATLQMLRSSMSGLHEQVINNMLDDGEYNLAVEYLSNNADSPFGLDKEIAGRLAETTALTLAEEQPELIEDFLQSESTKSLLNRKQINEIRKVSIDYIKKKVDLERTIEMQRNYQVETDFMARALGQVPRRLGVTADEDPAPPPTEKDIQEAVRSGSITEKFGDKLRKVIRRSNVTFSQDNPESYTNLLSEFEFIADADTDDLTFEQIALFRSKVLEALESGNVNESSARKFLEFTSPKFNEDFDDLFEEINKITRTGKIFDVDIEMFEDPNDQAEAKMNLQKELFRRIDKEEANLERRLRLSEVKALKDSVLEDFVLQTTVRANYRLGQIVQVPNANGEFERHRVVDFDAAGNPITDSDTSQPVVRPEKIPFGETK